MELELRGITKRFPGVLANDDITLTVRSGTVLALIGENGAGKSTLMNILSGRYQADSGQILIDGEIRSFEGPGDSIAAGIGMVYQHFMLVPVFTVAENVVLGAEPTKPLGVLDKRVAREQVMDISERYGLVVDPDALIETLPVGIQQRVEILKVLRRGAKILVFDEPTAVLTPQEVTEFFGIVAELKARGSTIIFITHKLKEALAIADDITVLRGGKVVGTADPKVASVEELATMMVGRDIETEVMKETVGGGEKVLVVENLTLTDDFDRPLLKSVSFEVRAGEIVGIAGVQGNGQTELVEAITGVLPVSSGRVYINGEDVTDGSPREHHSIGMAHVPEDRTHVGMVGSFSVRENLILDSYYSQPFSRRGRLNSASISDFATELVERFDVRPPLIDNLASALSGGNAQKMIVAREFSRDVPIVICAQPTRGIDVGSIEYIHEQIVRKRNDGKAILIVSTELDEIFSLADRILVMYNGAIIAERVTTETTPIEVGLLMAGRVAEAGAR
ncbi:MAG: ABC transporter ATP-binding protein [Actinomycetota bacterium]